MKPLFRLVVGASVLSALVATGNYACPRWSARAGLSPTAWLEVHQQLEDEHHREVFLSHEIQQAAQNLMAKYQVVEELRNHRLTLPEAAARFRKLSYPARDNIPEWFRRAYPGQTDAECWCRQVIRFLQAHSAEASSLADQFEAELTWRLAQGPLHLPD